jgi:hypothetical protein
MFPDLTQFDTHTHTHIRQDVSERAISLSQRPLHTQQTEETHIHALSGIRTPDPINQAATDVRFRPHGHRDGLHTELVKR